MTVDEYLTLSRLQIKALGENGTMVRDAPLGPTGGGHVFEFISYVGPTPIQCRQLILFQTGRAFVVTALTSAHQYEDYRRRLEKALDSVTIRFSGGSRIRVAA